MAIEVKPWRTARRTLTAGALSVTSGILHPRFEDAPHTPTSVVEDA
jgi:hypothetical protein